MNPTNCPESQPIFHSHNTRFTFSFLILQYAQNRLTKTIIDMRKIYISLLLSFPILLGSVFAQGTVSISGSIMGGDAEDRVKIVVDKYFVGKDKERHSLEVKKGGFKIDLELDRERFIAFRYNEDEIELFVEPGQDLQLVFNAGDMKNTLRMAGTAAPANRFLEDFNKEFNDWENEKTLEAKAISDNIDLFEMDLFEARIQQRQFLKEYNGKDKLSPTFKAYAKRHIELNYWSALWAYPIRRANQQLKVMKVGKIPSIMISEFDEETVLNEDNAMIDPAYRSLVWYYVTYKTSESNEFMKYTNMGKSMTDKYNNSFDALEGQTRLYYLSRLLHEYCIKTPPSVVRRVHKALESIDEEGGYTKIATERCGDRMQEEDEVLVQEETVEPGVGASSFKMTNLNGKQITLKEFKGKVVYIDFWASWCGPCRKQFPFAKELKHNLTKSQKKQIVFLYISIDNTEQIWKSAIDKLGIEGYHVLSKGGWNSKAVKFFGINSIPRYMIVDKKGKIVDIDAKRPQMQGLLDDLLGLL